MTARSATSGGPLLTVEAAAERLSTSPRFIRRLIAERRIEFVKVGRHVRISEAALADFIESGKVSPLTAASVRHNVRGVALWRTEKVIAVSATYASYRLAGIRSATQDRTGDCERGQKPTYEKVTRTRHSY
jgi:excisionase family DNA binding protein